MTSKLAERIAKETAQQFCDQCDSAEELHDRISKSVYLGIYHTFVRPNANLSNMDIDPVWIDAELFDLYWQLPSVLVRYK